MRILGKSKEIFYVYTKVELLLSYSPAFKRIHMRMHMYLQSVNSKIHKI